MKKSIILLFVVFCFSSLIFSAGKSDNFSKGKAAFEADKFEKAIQYFDKAITAGPDNAEAYMYRGRAKNAVSDKSAAEDLQMAIKLDPKMAQAWYGLGMTRSKAGDHYRAIKFYTKAIGLDPKYKMAYMERGYEFEEKKDYDKAMKDFSVVIELDAKYADGYWERGYIYGVLQKFDKAIADYDVVLGLDSKNARAYSNRGLAKFGLKKYRESVDDFSMAIKMHEKSRVGLEELGIIYSNRGGADFYLGKYEDAVSDFDNAIRLNPKYVISYAGRSMAKEKLGDKKGAQADHKKAIELGYRGSFK